ncbi:hypothetical protein MPSI1_002339 [Malassezia psittaci]|uniref:Uncharacterized protein n=1 Tax=Malassezia psittaci TaxID=1821823 RepID=A0AAF0F776_9BASI|nr:hypothetical protein MPSI1_002339 [Malassezia psittaci]
MLASSTSSNNSANTSTSSLPSRVANNQGSRFPFRSAGMGMTPYTSSHAQPSGTSSKASSLRNQRSLSHLSSANASTASTTSSNGRNSSSSAQQSSTQPRRRRYNDTRDLDVIAQEIRAEDRAIRSRATSGAATPMRNFGSPSTDSLLAPDAFRNYSSNGSTPASPYSTTPYSRSQTSLRGSNFANMSMHTLPSRPAPGDSALSLSLFNAFHGISPSESASRRLNLPLGMDIGYGDNPYPTLVSSRMRDVDPMPPLFSDATGTHTPNAQSSPDSNLASPEPNTPRMATSPSSPVLVMSMTDSNVDPHLRAAPTRKSLFSALRRGETIKAKPKTESGRALPGNRANLQSNLPPPQGMPRSQSSVISTTAPKPMSTAATAPTQPSEPLASSKTVIGLDRLANTSGETTPTTKQPPPPPQFQPPTRYQTNPRVGDTSAQQDDVPVLRGFKSYNGLTPSLQSASNVQASQPPPPMPSAPAPPSATPSVPSSAPLLDLPRANQSNPSSGVPSGEQTPRANANGSVQQSVLPHASSTTSLPSSGQNTAPGQPLVGSQTGSQTGSQVRSQVGSQTGSLPTSTATKPTESSSTIGTSSGKSTGPVRMPATPGTPAPKPSSTTPKSPSKSEAATPSRWRRSLKSLFRSKKSDEGKPSLPKQSGARPLKNQPATPSAGQNPTVRGPPASSVSRPTNIGPGTGMKPQDNKPAEIPKVMPTNAQNTNILPENMPSGPSQVIVVGESSSPRQTAAVEPNSSLANLGSERPAPSAAMPSSSATFPSKEMQDAGLQYPASADPAANPAAGPATNAAAGPATNLTAGPAIHSASASQPPVSSDPFRAPLTGFRPANAGIGNENHTKQAGRPSLPWSTSGPLNIRVLDPSAPIGSSKNESSVSALPSATTSVAATPADLTPNPITPNMDPLSSSVPSASQVFPDMPMSMPGGASVFGAYGSATPSGTSTPQENAFAPSTAAMNPTPSSPWESAASHFTSAFSEPVSTNLYADSSYSASDHHPNQLYAPASIPSSDPMSQSFDESMGDSPHLPSWARSPSTPGSTPRSVPLPLDPAPMQFPPRAPPIPQRSVERNSQQSSAAAAPVSLASFSPTKPTSSNPFSYTAQQGSYMATTPPRRDHNSFQDMQFSPMTVSVHGHAYDDEDDRLKTPTRVRASERLNRLDQLTE